MKNEVFKNDGITVIALVITIIVMFLLAGVTTASIVGENSVIIRATEARDVTRKAQALEDLQLAVIESFANYHDLSYVKNKVENIGAANVTTTGTLGEENYKIQGTYKGYNFEINNRGKVTIN
ncbi:MAG: hypothetical protein IKF17_05905 [Clostridia bacterium]|nr:hypothetical protein [Clostridia bacterium]